MMNNERSCAVLCSGGLDSAILLAVIAQQWERVFPVYIRCGLLWESVELEYVQQFIQAIQPRYPSIQPLVLLEETVTDLYGKHWSVTGEEVPDAQTPDEAVYLPGRNVLLLAKTLLWCHLHQVHSIALGVLGSNPFPDASAAFFEQLANVVGSAVNDQMQIDLPFGQLHKVEVMHQGRDLPLEWTFSCIRPVGKQHCGRCNKCHERQQAFQAAQLADPTPYASEGSS